MKVKDLRILKLLPLAIILVITIGFVYFTGQLERNPYYNEQIQARNLMEESMKAVKAYKEEAGLLIYDYDYFNTGLLGEEYNELTTSLGSLEAKRTSANPDMAALLVKMFHQVGLKAKDHLAVGFSGSFPGLNLAVLAAAEAMDLDLTIISSFGSSTYGANQEGFSFPIILNRLYQDGYSKYKNDLVSLGGDDDVLKEKPADLVKSIVDQYESLAFNLYIQEDFKNNVKDKVDFYEKKKVDAYIAVGGNISFLGIYEKDFVTKQGILTTPRLRRQSYTYDYGILDYFLEKDIPTIHLLNLKKIVSDYGLPFDPIRWPEPGQSIIYYEKTYKTYPAFISLGFSALYLIFIAKDRYKDDKNN
ncbi:MAG: poly-gamma-glutamate system protein [Bacillota bacterium]|nr:poly-gamma-glutamate system protein [Bacillota bacterium]